MRARSLFNHHFFSVSLMLLASAFAADIRAAVPVDAYADLHWRQVGPFRGGWATAVEGHPDRVTTFYFGSADGGVWKTDNAGVSWQPLFEQHGSASGPRLEPLMAAACTVQKTAVRTGNWSTTTAAWLPIT